MSIWDLFGVGGTAAGPGPDWERRGRGSMPAMTPTAGPVPAMTPVAGPGPDWERRGRGSVPSMTPVSGPAVAQPPRPPMPRPAGLGQPPMPPARPAGVGSQPPAALQRPGIGDVLGGLFTGENADMWKRLAIGLQGMTTRPNQALIDILQSDLEASRADKDRNKTAEWLDAMGRPDLAEAVRGGVIAGSDAFAAMNGKANIVEVNGKLVNADTGEIVYDGGVSQEDGFKNEVETLKAYRADKDVQTYQSVRNYHDQMRSALDIAEQNADPQVAGPADITIIYSYMKMLDPGSTVMQGEYATAQNAGSIDQSIVGLYNSLLRGGTLSPDMRRAFVRQASAIYDSAARNLGRVNDMYGGVAQRYGVNPSFIIQPQTYPSLSGPSGPSPAGPSAVPFTVTP